MFLSQNLFIFLSLYRNIFLSLYRNIFLYLYRNIVCQNVSREQGLKETENSQKRFLELGSCATIHENITSSDLKKLHLGFFCIKSTQILGNDTGFSLLPGVI
jgi:hypothetical protein